MANDIIKNLVDPLNLKHVLQQYQDTCKSLSQNDKTKLSLQCFVEIYSKLEKAEWSSKVEPRVLYDFAFLLGEQMISLSPAHEKKYLASVTNVHRFLVKKKFSSDKCCHLSDQIFKSTQLKITSTNNKIYWIILVDKLSSLEQTANENCNHLNDLISNILHIASSYDLATFVKDLLPWLLKKLFNLYNENYPKEFNLAIDKLFTELDKNNKIVKECDKKDDVFKNCLACLSSINPNVISCNFENASVFSKAMILFCRIFDKESVYYFYLSSLNNLFPALVKDGKKVFANTDRMITNFVLKVLEKKEDDNMIIFLGTVRKILNANIVHAVAMDNSLWELHMPINVQLAIIKLIFVIVKILSKSKNQSVICENCTFASAIHDGINLIRFIRNFVSRSIKCKINISPLVDVTYESENLKFKLLKVLFDNKCPNWNKYWTNFEMETHNNAISFYSKKLYEDSMRHFQIYISQFTQVVSWDIDACDFNNLSRSFYNMAICQNEMENYKEALQSCYIHLILRAYLGQNSDCNDFSLQIKSKVYNISKLPNEKNALSANEIEDVLKFSILDASNQFLLNKSNAVFKNIFLKVDYSMLFLDEFITYFKVWSSSQIVSYSCESFMKLLQDNETSERFKDMIINAGKSVTLIGISCNKLMNDSIIKFIRYVTSKLESNINNCKKIEENFIMKIILANCLQICYECNILEMRQNVDNVNSETLENNKPAHHETPHPDDACDVAPTHQYLNLKKEYEAIGPIYKAIDLCKTIVSERQLLKEITKYEEFNILIQQSVDLIERTSQFLLLHHLDVLAIMMIDFGYTLSNFVDYKFGIVKFTGLILEEAKISDTSLRPLINTANKIILEVLENNTDDLKDLDLSLVYLLNLALYYFHTGHYEKGSTLLIFVNCKLLELNDSKLSNFKVSYPKLSFVSAIALQLYPNKKADGMNSLTTHIQAHSECTEIMRSCNDRRNRQWLLVIRLWLDSAVMASKIAASLGLPRRVRGLLKNPLTITQKFLYPQRSSHILTLLANIDLQAERFDDCRVKLDGLSFILNEKNQKETNFEKVKLVKRSKSPVFQSKLLPNAVEENAKCLESVLDIPAERYQGDSIGSSPTFQPSPFCIPEFVDHKKTCACIKCTSVSLFSISLNVARLEAILRFRVDSSSAAESFFNGSWRLLKYLHSRKSYIVENYTEKLINPFCKTILLNIEKEESVSAECRLCLDTNLYYFANNNFINCMNLISHAEKLQNGLPSKNDFIMQEINEQKTYLLYLKSKLSNEEKEYRLKESKMDQLNIAFSSKLKLTPEKKNDENVYKTPMNKKIQNTGRKTAIKHSRRNINDEFVRPAIKLSLDEDDENKDVNFKKLENSFLEPSISTPRPDMKAFKVPKVTIASPKRYSRISKPKASTSVLAEKPCDKNVKPKSQVLVRQSTKKSSLIRSTSPSLLENKPTSSAKNRQNSDDSLDKKYTLRKRN